LEAIYALERERQNMPAVLRRGRDLCPPYVALEYWQATGTVKEMKQKIIKITKLKPVKGL
jgi:hypothetical protein